MCYDNAFDHEMLIEGMTNPNTKDRLPVVLSIYQHYHRRNTRRLLV
jgi:hypothetical protein